MLSATVLAGGQPGQPGAQPSQTIVPGTRFGPIEESTSRARLATLFGAHRVRDADVSIGEDICSPGTEVLPGSADALDVAWQDAARTRVAFVRTRSTGTRWVTPRGVHIGTTLRELERLAGKVLTFSGFGWDYGGGLAWTEDAAELRLQIDPRWDDPNAIPARDTPEIFGDRIVSSDHPAIRRLKIRVNRIQQGWGGIADEVNCG